MTQQEFEQRTQVRVTAKEYEAINAVYMESDIDKDNFCKLWCKMNYRRVSIAKKEKTAKERKEEFIWKMGLLACCTSIEDYNKSADNYYTAEEKKGLERIGICMQDKINGVSIPKTVSRIVYEIKLYLNKAR